jgi:DNA-binding response OmpR family regulator
MNNSTIRPLRILLVENHADTLKWFTLYLEEQGHTVITASTLAEAQAALPECNCDVLISDIGLPDGTGWELLEQAHLSHPIFAIAMSGFGMNADSVHSQQAGYRYHLLKPFRIDDLDHMLQEAAALPVC